MTSLPLGLLLMIGTFTFLLSHVDLGLFMNVHSIVLIGVGTLAVLAIATPLRSLKSLWESLLELRHSEFNKEELDAMLVELASNRNANVDNVHPLIRYAQKLWIQGVDQALFTVMLTQQLESLNRKGEQGVLSLKNLAKYPPALGMTGTVIGVVSLFGNLTPESRSTIGPNLALAMTATFFGLMAANGIIMPLSDRLHMKHVDTVMLNEYVFRIIVLINKGCPQPVIEEGMHESAA